MTESLRLPDEKISKYCKTIPQGQDDIPVDFWDINGLLDTQLSYAKPLIEADLLSKVSTPERLIEAIEDILPCGHAGLVDRIIVEVQSYALSLQEQAIIKTKMDMLLETTNQVKDAVERAREEEAKEIGENLCQFVGNLMVDKATQTDGKIVNNNLAPFYKYIQKRAGGYLSRSSPKGRIKNMDKPTKEHQKKFWEWCGFTDVQIGQLTGTMQGWFNGELVHIPNIDSLEFMWFLFKYAVPKVMKVIGEDGMIFFHHPLDHPEVWYVDLLDADGNSIDLNGNVHYSADPALALFWAIWEIIKKEG